MDQLDLNQTIIQTDAPSTESSLQLSNDPTNLGVQQMNTQIIDSSLVNLAPAIVTVLSNANSLHTTSSSLTPLPEPLIGTTNGQKQLKRQREDKSESENLMKLKSEKRELEIANKDLTTKLREHDNYKKVVRNLVEFFGSLPQTSPLRQPLYKVVCKDLSFETARKMFGISPTTWKRIKKVELSPLMIKSLPNQSRKKVSDEDRDKFRAILDILLPFSNGRNYRVQSKTTKDLYEDYKKLCQERGVKMFSKSYFRRQLKMENIHHKKMGTGKRDDSAQEESPIDNHSTSIPHSILQHSIQMPTPVPLQSLHPPGSLSLQISSQSLPFPSLV